MRDNSINTDLVLISMPWSPLNMTPIQLGILQSVVQRAGFSCQSKSYFLELMKWFETKSRELEPNHPITISDYNNITLDHKLGLGAGLQDWIFAGPPFRESTDKSDQDFYSFLRR